jgi:hypothetical protein
MRKPRPEELQFLANIGWTFAVILAALVLYLVTSSSAHAEEGLPIERIEAQFPCLNPECTHVGMPAALVEAIAETNRGLAEENARLRKLDETRGEEIALLEKRLKRKCTAELEVVPPPKRPAPLFKKERDS